MSSTRLLVLKSFKKLHRTRLKIFSGDERALAAGRIKINEEFKKNKNATDDDSIRTMIKFAEDVDVELRTQVIQAQEVKPGVYVARITDETVKFDNKPYDENAVLEDGTVNRPCCQDQEQKNK